MEWVRFEQAGTSNWGRMREGVIHVCTGSPLQAEHQCGAHCSLERLPLEMTPLLAPCAPSKIVCIGRNYRDHAKELGNAVPAEPLFFLKPPSSLLDPGGAVELPPLSQQVEFEGELGVVIRRRCRRLGPQADLTPYILGFTCVNDVTARDLQKSDPQWTRAKGFDTFCPAGPGAVDLPWESVALGLELETRVNGELRQRGNTRDFIFSLPQIFAAITEVMTLEPGDLIATGTPAGVGRLHPGDRVSVSIAGVGCLEHSVAGAAART